ncbi:MAG: FecR domain-containing protein [Balneolaceae bacterium]
MTEKNIENKKSGLDEVLKQFPAEERDGVAEVWKESGKAGPAVKTSKKETEQALAGVHERIDLETYSASAANKTSGYFRVWMAAAVVMIILAAGWLLLPKTVTVPRGEIAMLELPDGSSVEMNSGTTIWYSRLFSYTGRSLKLQGEAFFDVKTGNHPFRVEAGGTVVEVTGTRFNVRSWSDDPGSETSVAVTEGEVQFYRLDEAENKVVLRPGEISTWHTSLAGPSLPEPVSAGDVAVWRDQRFVFQDKPLLSIFNELERRYDVQIYLEAPGFSFETLTAYYNQPQNLERILEDICMVKGLRYAETANGYRIFK